MASSNGTRTRLEGSYQLARELLNTIGIAIGLGDEETAIRLVAELAVFLVSIDKKCVAKGQYGNP